MPNQFIRIHSRELNAETSSMGPLRHYLERGWQVDGLACKSWPKSLTSTWWRSMVKLPCQFLNQLISRLQAFGSTLEKLCRGFLAMPSLTLLPTCTLPKGSGAPWCPVSPSYLQVGLAPWLSFEHVLSFFKCPGIRYLREFFQKQLRHWPYFTNLGPSV